MNMKRATAIVVLTCGIAGVSAPAYAQRPSGVVGYIAFIDPATGERWSPRSAEGAVLGAPRQLVFTFRSGDGREQRVAIEDWAGSQVLPDAVKYEVEFHHHPIFDPTWLRPSAGARPAPMQIHFNFERWTYVSVEAGPWRLLSSEGRETSVPLARRATPFPDLR